jgi:hypothetical protein
MGVVAWVGNWAEAGEGGTTGAGGEGKIIGRAADGGLGISVPPSPSESRIPAGPPEAGFWF